MSVLANPAPVATERDLAIRTVNLTKTYQSGGADLVVSMVSS